MKSGRWAEASSIKEEKWAQACEMQKQQLVGALGLLWKTVEEKLLVTKIDDEVLALTLESQVSCTNIQWDELKVHDTVIRTGYIIS